MNLIVDGIILLIFALCIFLGYKRGLVGVAFKILSFIAAIIIAFLLYKPVANFVIKNTTFDEQIEAVIINTAKGNSNAENVTAGNEVDTNSIKESGTSQIISDYIDKQIENAAQSAKEGIANSVARTVAINIINGACLIILFILSKIILLLAKFIFNGIASLPIIKQFNKAGGLIYGILEGIIIVYILLAILSFIAPMTTNLGIIEAVNKSILGSIMYNNNLLLKIIF